MRKKKKKENNIAVYLFGLIVLIAIIVLSAFIWLNRYEFFPSLVKNGVSVCFLGANGENKIVKYNYPEGTGQTRFEYAVRKLINGPTQIQKIFSTYSEIPVGTKIIAIIQENDKNIIDLTSEFNTGGGTEGIYKKLSQVIETVLLNTVKPTYLFINGQQVEVFGGEGIMITQPLSKNSL